MSRTGLAHLPLPIEVLHHALHRAKVGRNEKLHAFRRLAEFAG